MVRNRRTTYGILVVAVGLLTAAGLAWAQSSTYPSESQLTGEQARQLDELRGQYEEKMLTLEKQLAAAEVELDRAMTRPDTDTDRVLALRREVRKLEGQLEDLYLQANAEAAGVVGVRPGSTFNGVDPLGFGWAPGWHGSCSWDRCPWDAGRMSGHRGNRWWSSDSWMGRKDMRSGRGHCCS